MANRIPKGFIREGGGVLSRGLVPDSSHGIQDRVMSAYIRGLDIDNNEPLKLALASSEDKRFQEFLDRLSSGKYKSRSLASLAKGVGLSLGEFQGFWQRASAQAAIALAQTSSIKLTEDMIGDARSKTEACSRCDGLRFVGAPPGLPADVPGYRSFDDGSGEIKFIRDCPNCSDGTQTKPGDSFSRDKLLNMAGIVQKGGPAVNINVGNFAGASHASAVQSLSVMSIDVESEDASDEPT